MSLQDVALIRLISRLGGTVGRYFAGALLQDRRVWSGENAWQECQSRKDSGDVHIRE